MNAGYTLGEMPMPADFRYREVARRGRPRHGAWDGFTFRHPPMPAARWAKIFSPFDALSGFGDAIRSRETQYVYRPEPDADGAAELSRRLSVLAALTRNGRTAQTSRAAAAVRYFIPCADVEESGGGRLGTCRTVSGIVTRVDPVQRTLTLRGAEETVTVALDDILRITLGTRIRGEDREPEAE